MSGIGILYAGLHTEERTEIGFANGVHVCNMLRGKQTQKSIVQ
jgi:hypothetical protein